MNTTTYEPDYISIAVKPRIIASGKGLLAFAFAIYQGWYLVLFERSLLITWTNSMIPLKDQINPLISMFAHAGLTGVALGYAAIALRSAVSGYAPTKGTVTFRSFGARYQSDASSEVNITEETPSNSIAFVSSRGLEEDNVDTRYREESISTDVRYPENTSSQEETHETKHSGELTLEEVSQVDEQDVQQAVLTRALIVYPASHEERNVPQAQVTIEVAEVRKGLYFLVSLFKELVVTVVLTIGTVIKKCHVNLDNRLKSFAAFLATRVKGTKLIWDDFIDKVFHSVEDGSLDQAKYDLNKKVNEALQTLDQSHLTIEVFEGRKSKKSSPKKRSKYTALLHDWYAEEPLAELLAYHSLVRDIQTDPANTFDIPLDRLRQVYTKLIPDYKEKGFLGEELEHDKDNRWCWAKGHYLSIRDGQLIFIFYCAQCEEKTSTLRLK